MAEKLLQELPASLKPELQAFPPETWEVPELGLAVQLAGAIQGKKTPDATRKCQDAAAVDQTTHSALVADGVTKSSFADLAATTAIQATTEHLTPETSGIPTVAMAEAQVLAALKEANLQVYAKSQELNVSMGTTIVTASLAQKDGKPYVVVGWVGDSRAYVLYPHLEKHGMLTADDGIVLLACGGDERQAILFQKELEGFTEETVVNGEFVAWLETKLTTVPNPVYLEMILQQAKVPDGLGQEPGTPIIPSAIQAFNMLRNIIDGNLGQFSTIKPHVLSVPFPPGSKLLLCSDGISDVLTEAVIGQVLQLNLSADLQSQALLHLADLITGLYGKNDDRVAVVIQATQLVAA